MDFLIKKNDELMHWKYIKKERVNGKWKYYYDPHDLFSKDINGSNDKAQYSVWANKNKENNRKNDARSYLYNDSKIKIYRKKFKRDFTTSKTISKKFKSAINVGRTYVDGIKNTTLRKLNTLGDGKWDERVFDLFSKR